MNSDDTGSGDLPTGFSLSLVTYDDFVSGNQPETRRYVAMDTETRLYYRGARFWRWTRFPSMAAHLTWCEWEAVADVLGWSTQWKRFLLFNAPPDRWPRGRYNGQRIVGLRATVVIDVDEWNWIPRFGPRFTRCIRWLCCRVHIDVEYANT